MDNGENFYASPNTISDDVGRSWNNPLTRSSHPTLTPDIWIGVQNHFGPTEYVRRKLKGCSRVVTRDEILNMVEVSKGRDRPGNFHQAGRYLFNTSAISASLANAARSAAAIPAATFATKCSCHSIECPFSRASAITSEADKFDRVTIAMTRSCRLRGMSMCNFIFHS